MKTYKITEARKNLTAVLSSVVAGQEVAILYGKEFISLKRLNLSPSHPPQTTLPTPNPPNLLPPDRKLKTENLKLASSPPDPLFSFNAFHDDQADDASDSFDDQSN